MSGVDFNIEAADDIDDNSSTGFLNSVAPIEVPEGTVTSSCEVKQPEEESANENVVPSVVLNGFAAPSSPPIVKKKRPYNRKSAPKSEGDPVVKLLKLSPNTIARHTNGDMDPPAEPVPLEPEPLPIDRSPESMVMPVPMPKKRTVNGPNLLRNKQVKKKVVGKSKPFYRKADRLSESQNRTSVLGVKPLDSPVEDNGLVECVKCSAVVSVLSARDHLAVCTGGSTSVESDIGTKFSSRNPGFVDAMAKIFSTILVPSPVDIQPPIIPIAPPAPIALPSPISPSKGYGTRASSIRSVQSTYGPDACGLCGARGLSDGLSRYLHAHLHHQRHACLVCGSMHAKVSALVKHLQAVHGKEDR